MQLKALPGQPVCKHSVSMCFGRAPAPRAHSKLQQGGQGCAPAAAPGGPPTLGPGGGDGRAPHGTPSSRASGSAGRAGGRQAAVGLGVRPQPRFVCNSWLFLAAPRSLSGPGGGAGKCLRPLGWGVSRWPSLVSVLPPSSWAPAGQPRPRVCFGLSAWSF